MDGGMLIIVLGMATAFNVIVILSKMKAGRGQDALTDGGFLVLFAWILGGSTQSLAVGTIASVCVSIYLWTQKEGFLLEVTGVDKLLEDEEEDPDPYGV